MKTKKAVEPVLDKPLSTRESKILMGLCGLIVAGIYYSTALVTISMVGIVFLSLRHLSIEKTRRFLADFTMFPFLLLFLLVFLSGGNSSDQEAWRTAVVIKLPFLVLPVAFYMLPKIGKKAVIHLHLWLLVVSCIVGIPVLLNALFYPDEMLQLISRGQHLPTPIEAVKYSMFNAYASLTGIILYVEFFQTNERTARYLTAAAIGFILILMHVLAVRTGLVITYCSLLVYGCIHMYRQRSRRRIVILFAAFLLVPIVLYLTIPSLRYKIEYMRHDWKQYEEDSGSHYSDSERFLSYKAGWHLWKRAPVMGVGYGDVRSESHDFYTSYEERPDLFKLPHSQFLLTLAGAGILGMFMLLAGFYTPILQFRRPHLFRTLLVFIYLNYTLSFLVENSLERSMSVAFFLVFALILIKGLNEEEEILESAQHD